MNNHKMKTGVVVLSRFSSSRLPGKALMEIKGKPVLQYIIERLLVVFSKEEIIIATSDESTDDPIAKFAASSGVKCFRGSLENVAERFFLAARELGCDYAIRINGDNIFLDTQVLQRMITLADGNRDFISNVKGRTFPKGMSIEIVKVAYYGQMLESINRNPGYREHVTLALYESEDQDGKYYVTNTELPEAAGIQMALDTREDFERSKAIIERFTEHQVNYNLKEIMDILSEIHEH